MPDFTIRGNPGAIRSKAQTMRSKSELFTQTGDGLAKITTGGWVSRSADRFKDKFDTEPGRWRDAGSDWRTAASALDDYADALADAQRRAAAAEKEHARGDQVTQDAKGAYDADVSRAKGEAARDRAAGMTVDLTILPFHDPGEAVRQGALSDLASARSDLDAAAHNCASGVKAGCAHAPKKRNWLEKAGGAVGSFFSGAGEALLDLGKLAAFLTMPEIVIPMMLMNDLGKGMTAEEIAAKYKLKLEDAGNMVKFAVENPAEFGKTLGKAVLDWDTWKDDPARALGHLLPDAVIAVLTLGSGTAATRGAKGVTDGMKGLESLSKMDDLARLRRLDDVEDLGAVNRLDDLDSLHAFDDVPTGPQGVGRHLDDPELESWLDDVAASHPELDRDGVRGVWDYTTNDGYDTMNKAMRGTTPMDQATADRIAATSKGLDQLPPHQGTTYRGTDVPQFKLDEMARTGKYYDDAFSSSSVNPSTAENFIPSHAKNPTFFTIEGKTGVNVQPFSAAQHEGEILFQGGRQFEILDSTPDAKGVLHVVLRELP